MLINIQDSACKDLKKLDKSEVIKILQTIKKLEDYPHITNVKKLKNKPYSVLFE